MTAGTDAFATGQHIDLMPVGKAVLDRLVGTGILGQELAECFIGKHHTETEGVVRQVALIDGDLVSRISLFHQQGQIEAGRAAPDNRDAHGVSHPCQRGEVIL